MTGLRGVKESIRLRVSAVAASAALVAATIGSVLFVLSLHHSLETGLRTTASQEISTIRAQLVQGGSPADVVVTGGTDIVVQLVSPSGTVLVSDHQETLSAPLLLGPGVTNDIVIPGQDDLFTVVGERVDGVPGVALIVVGRSTSETDRARDVTMLQLLVAVPLMVVLLALIVWVSVGRALRPVEEMRRAADAITSTHLHRRLAQPPGKDEIPRLAATLNEMLDRIDQSHRLQRQFVSDASHELRSPLSAIRQTAEVAQNYPGQVSVDVLAADVLAEGHRLESLVSALLLLARLDDDAQVVGNGLVDVDDLVLEEVTRVRRSADSVTIDVSHVSGGQVSGSAVLLAQVVRNLVENAVRHASSRVVVSLGERDGWVELTVDDDGVGVPIDDRERIFERFVRLDEARAREAGGSGLGLAIVLKIVELSGGTVLVAQAPGSGARFAVRLPVAS